MLQEACAERATPDQTPIPRGHRIAVAIGDQPRRLRTDLLALILLPALGMGCAFPLGTSPEGHQRELLLGGYTASNEDAAKHRRALFGFDLQWNAESRTALFGFTDEVACLLDFGSTRKEATGFEVPFGIAWRDSGGTLHRLGAFVSRIRQASAENPAFRYRLSLGVGATIETSTRAATLGVSRTTILAVPSMTDGLYELTFSSRGSVATPCLLRIKRAS